MKNIDKWKKDVLVRWVLENKTNPYPSEDIKEALAQSLNLTKKQVSNWFTNARKVRAFSFYSFDIDHLELKYFLPYQ